MEEFKNYLKLNVVRDQKVMEVFYNVTIGEFVKFTAAIEIMEKGGNDDGDGKKNFDAFITAIESNPEMKKILLKIEGAKQDD